MDIQGMNFIGGVNINGAAALYPFTTWTFTNANSTGQFGPTTANLRALYDTSSNTWINSDSYFTSVNGVQYWTVPETGTYTITAAGATGGGNYNLGARLSTIASLNRGEVVQIAVGQRGANASAAYGTGGGGTFVVRYPFNSNASIIVIAGGGGGVSRPSTIANSATSGGQATSIPGTTSGAKATGGGGGGGYISAGGLNGAAGTDQGTSGYSGGGGGFFGNGGGSTGEAVGGRAWRFGANGGPNGTGSNAGGFGGGGGQNSRGSGGGGYNGGNAGDSTYDGAGGSSYIAGPILYAASNINLGNGFVTITAGGTVTNTLSTNIAFTYGATVGTTAGSPFATTVNSYTIVSQPASATTYNHISVPGGSGYAMGTGDYTVEWFEYMTGSASNMRGFWYGTFASASLGISLEGSDSGKIVYHWPSISNLGTIALTSNVWQHMALVRISGRLYFYFNGNCINPGGTVNTTNITDTTGTMYFASRAGGGVQSEHFIGSMTNMRVVKGLGVYTGNFTVPTGPLSTIAAANPFGGANTAAITSGLTSLLLNP